MGRGRLSLASNVTRTPETLKSSNEMDLDLDPPEMSGETEAEPLIRYPFYPYKFFPTRFWNFYSDTRSPNPYSRLNSPSNSRRILRTMVRIPMEILISQ